jgi:hypothetical protein
MSFYVHVGADIFSQFVVCTALKKCFKNVSSWGQGSHNFCFKPGPQEPYRTWIFFKHPVVVELYINMAKCPLLRH